MSLYLIVDEQNRINGIKIYDDGIRRIVNTNGISYLGARKMYQEMGDKMGLEKLTLKDIEEMI